MTSPHAELKRLTDHAALIERLEKAEAGSQAALDSVDDLRAALGFGARNTRARYLCWSALGGSIDAALALAERVLKGWKRSLFEHGDGWMARVQAPDEKLPDGRGWVSGPDAWAKHSDPATALCIALLKALRSQQKGER